METANILFYMQKQFDTALLIVDDHPVYLGALGEFLSREFKHLNVEVFAASSAGDALERVDAMDKFWVVLLDVKMAGLSGLASIKVFKHKPNVKQVVSISGLEASAWEPRTVAAGSTMFLSKNNTASNIYNKVKTLFEANSLPSELTSVKERPAFRLTQRQLEVLKLISLGHPNKIIADQLEIKEQTVKIHINQIFKELRVFNRTQAVLVFQQHQLLSN